MSFLLKTFEDIAEDVFLNGIFILPEIILERVNERNIFPRLLSPIGTTRSAALADFVEVLQEPFGAIKSTLVNPELIELLREVSPVPILHAIDVIRATRGGFTVGDDPLVFLREYILNFRGVGWVVDFVASFWAGLEPTNLDEMQILLQECATVSNIGQEYSMISLQETSAGETCGDFYMKLYGDYLRNRNAFVTLLGDDTGFPTRLNVTMGETSLTVLIATSILTGDAVSAVLQGQEQYINSIFDVDFEVTWADGVFFGFFGPEPALATISSFPICFPTQNRRDSFPLDQRRGEKLCPPHLPNQHFLMQFGLGQTCYL